MKLIKIFGLAAVAALMAMAFVGASSAMAEDTALCKEDTALLDGSGNYVTTDACPAGKLVTHVHEETLTGHKAKLLDANGNVLVECDVLFLGDVVSTNNLGNPLVILGEVASEGGFTYANCGGCTVEQESAHATIEVLREGHEKAYVKFIIELHQNCVGINCYYNGIGLASEGLGPLLNTEETNGGVKIENKTVNKVKGLFCPATSKLDLLTTPLEKVYLSK